MGVSFDERSAGRISNAVIAVERGLGIPSRRLRRPKPPGATAELLTVRLIEDVPAATLSPETLDNFYPKLTEALGVRVGYGAIAETKTDQQLLAIAARIAANAPGVVLGSGLAYVCQFEMGTSVVLPAGRTHRATVSYTEVARVWNAHNRAYNTQDEGGIPGSENGSLGGGFCNAMQGPDGELWLVSRDLRLVVEAV